MSTPQSIAIPKAKNANNYTLSTSVGGTIYGTTPGGTRIVYKRKDLMNIRNSPLAGPTVSKLPSIPGITLGATAEDSKSEAKTDSTKTTSQDTQTTEDTKKQENGTNDDVDISDEGLFDME